MGSVVTGRERLERYSLTGPENQAAVNAGLAGGAWFRSAVPRKRMKELMRRSDYPAVRDTVIWTLVRVLALGVMSCSRGVPLRANLADTLKSVISWARNRVM